ncbi:hypothetical protein NC653_038757 [Populus alba x Populus x berolinensis]|uniref:Uncharacterized protein n=1 Tax=Populus alba x Populus x berolinensis TaxID=444605 RepID=A0AAD6LK88_9ROSI|nr:hypothetical protein NC653_038757 [Populus alba x Populus x berolinensis]
MGSQGKTRYLTIMLLVTIILLSCSYLTAPRAPCKYDPKDGTCQIGDPAAKFDGGRS